MEIAQQWGQGAAGQGERKTSDLTVWPENTPSECQLLLSKPSLLRGPGQRLCEKKDSEDRSPGVQGGANRSPLSTLSSYLFTCRGSRHGDREELSA